MKIGDYAICKQCSHKCIVRIKGVWRDSDDGEVYSWRVDTYGELGNPSAKHDECDAHEGNLTPITPEAAFPYVL